ncbi:MAG TPA: hypothetical protein VK327_05980 [Candidatus Paceibacterota bacterium]|nr:hypothetical protein [Candidatus Paceibacterota bacterium]
MIRHRSFKTNPRAKCTLALTMNDLIYIAIVVAFFATCGLYVRFCEKL